MTRESQPVLASSEAAFDEAPIYRVLEANGDLCGTLPNIGVDVLLKMHRTMVLLRVFDERMMVLQRQGRIGFHGSCTGEEATPVGVAAALRPTDWVFPALRQGGVLFYRGFEIRQYLAQTYGTESDICRGRQMPSHPADRSLNYVSWGSCIGTQIPQAVGAAWGAKLKGHDTVTVGFMGDGATSEADFHVGLNFAAVYKTPCLLVCQNNHWAISIPTGGQSKSRTIAEKALAYGLPYARVDGNDVLAVYAVCAEAAERARSGGGATFIEALTYRIGAHSSSDDPRVYRDEAEVDVWKLRDPVERYTRFMIAQGHLTEKDDIDLRAELSEHIIKAIAEIEAEGPPEKESLIEQVFAEVPTSLREQADAWLFE